ncbi:hypothetical protein CQA43_02195 [Helicobacter ganmani]|uniref:Uncharacterized protein n=1 Tax=Helicobacter ganmani TaxID=60246 RepID=A0A3D8IEW8_9HELI|nr:hypothetical protein CQA43_02195 [Helicobacter ganmani]
MINNSCAFSISFEFYLTCFLCWIGSATKSAKEIFPSSFFASVCRVDFSLEISFSLPPKFSKRSISPSQFYHFCKV